MIGKETINRSFWALPAAEALDILETTATGLNQDEAERRLSIFGHNIVPGKTRAPRLAIFFRQLKNPLIFLLLLSGGVTLFLRDFKDAAFILAAAFINSLLGFYQENKAEAALEHLRSYIEERVRVYRDGHETEIDAEELVPGDIVHLSQGDRVPADCRIIYANDVMVDQAVLTGESLPVHKSKAPVGFHVPLADQTAMLFSGTTVVQGFADALVTATGAASEIGKIALLVRGPEREKTPLQEAMSRFTLKVGFLLVAATSLIFALGVASGQPVFNMFLIAVAMAVSAVPEGLPVALTVILAIGVQRLAHKKGIVRKLLAAETLGSTTVILTDKTGTLTQAKMSLSQIRLFDSAPEDMFIKLSILNSDVVIENPKDNPANWEIIGRPLEVAAVRAAASRGILWPKVKKELTVVDYLPFNSSNKFSAAIIKRGNGHLLSLFGAPEVLLKHSDAPAERQREIIKAIDKMAYAGDRVLGVAVKEISDIVPLNDKKSFRDVNFLGTISFRDPLRPGVKEAIERVSGAGVRTVIVTGDHRGTAEAIAKDLGIKFNREGVIEGPELDLLNEAELIKRLPELKIVSRVSPEGKLKIVKAFQSQKAVVAMTGDGVNDAPGLRQADIGVSMGSGSDVAKDVADLVLLDDNFKTIVKAISEGRRILANIRKVIVYTLSNALDEVILIGGALLAGLPLPFNPLQILWVNFFTDSFPGIALAVEDGIDRLKQPPPKLHKALLDRDMKFLIMVIGVLSSLILFGLYYALLKLGFAQELVKTFIFAVFGTYTLFLIFAVRSLKRSVFTLNPIANPYLIISVLLGLGLMGLSIYAPFFQELLGTVFLPPEWLWGVFGIGAFNVLLIEFGKWLLKKRGR